MEEQEASYYLRQFVHATHYCHKHRVAHRSVEGSCFVVALGLAAGHVCCSMMWRNDMFAAAVWWLTSMSQTDIGARTSNLCSLHRLRTACRAQPIALINPSTQIMLYSMIMKLTVDVFAPAGT